jgi:hypothetical protein
MPRWLPCPLRPAPTCAHGTTTARSRCTNYHADEFQRLLDAGVRRMSVTLTVKPRCASQRQCACKFTAMVIEPRRTSTAACSTGCVVFRQCLLHAPEIMLSLDRIVIKQEVARFLRHGDAAVYSWPISVGLATGASDPLRPLKLARRERPPRTSSCHSCTRASRQVIGLCGRSHP